MLILGDKCTANKFARVVFHPPVKTRGLPHFPEVLGDCIAAEIKSFWAVFPILRCCVWDFFECDRYFNQAASIPKSKPPCYLSRARSG